MSIFTDALKVFKKRRVPLRKPSSQPRSKQFTKAQGQSISDKKTTDADFQRVAKRVVAKRKPVRAAGPDAPIALDPSILRRRARKKAAARRS